MRGLFCDFETTGLPKRGVSDWNAQPGIVQLGVVIYDDEPEVEDGIILRDAGPVAEFASFVNPELSAGAWEEGAIKTHGITPEAVAMAPTFYEIFPKLADLAKGCDFWGGYNSGFDKEVLWHQLNRYGFQCNFPWPPAEIDVMKLVGDHFEEQGKSGKKRYKQTEAYARLFGEELEAAHDALADIKATVRIYRKLNGGTNAA